MKRKRKKLAPIKQANIKYGAACDAIMQMLEKARKDGVETAFDRAANMKACQIGADSACGKHCAMGPCRLNPKDPIKLEEVAKATGIEVEGREIKDIAMDLYHELERTYNQTEGEIPFAMRVPQNP